MTRTKQFRVIFALIMIVVMMMPTAVFAAQHEPADGATKPEDRRPARPGDGPAKPPVHIDGPAMAGTGPAVPPPIAITGPRVNPRVIPHTDVVDPSGAYSWAATNVPQALEADAADGGKNQEKPGRGIKQTQTGIGAGLTLYATPNVCADFNTDDNYAVVNGKSDIWSDWYAGWAPFAIDNGYYQAKNVAFTMERVVGPGNEYGDDQHSVKIASHEPYAGGFGSPIIAVPEEYRGGKVTVSVKYLIWDHDQGGEEGEKDGADWDWASMGIKPGAAGDQAFYVNGYVRGEWAELTHTVDLGPAADIMVLLQGHSPAVLNSNIYFDDVKIAFTSGDGSKSVYLTSCTADGNIR